MSATFWDQRADGYDTRIQEHSETYTQTIDSTIALLSSKDVVLDFGCASDQFALDIAPHVQQIQGVDLSRKMIGVSLFFAAAIIVTSNLLQGQEAQTVTWILIAIWFIPFSLLTARAATKADGE